MVTSSIDALTLGPQIKKISSMLSTHDNLYATFMRKITTYSNSLYSVSSADTDDPLNVQYTAKQ